MSAAPSESQAAPITARTARTTAITPEPLGCSM